MFNILVADDDNIFRQLICDILIKQGYTIIEATDGKEAMDKFFSNEGIVLCILDVMMPVYDGWEVLKEIRKKSEIPVLMLTALNDEVNEVKGLLGGADDYITKPFSYAVFLARIEALLRKTKKQLLDNVAVGGITIDYASHKVLIDGQEVELNNKEYNLLCCLVRNTGFVLSRETILENVWGYGFEGDIRTIDTHIKTLRSKLNRCGEYIKTVRGTGYVLEV